MELKQVNLNIVIANIILGQTVPHTHVHIIPQNKDGNMQIQESERK